MVRSLGPRKRFRPTAYRTPLRSTERHRMLGSTAYYTETIITKRRVRRRCGTCECFREMSGFDQQFCVRPIPLRIDFLDAEDLTCDGWRKREEG